MEIKKDLFEKSDLNVEKEALKDMLTHDERTLWLVNGMYIDIATKYYGRSVYLMHKKMKPDTLEKYKKQIKSLIAICVDLALPFETYMKAQFELLERWRKTYGRKYVPFNMMTSETARRRMDGYDVTRVGGYHIKDFRAEHFLPDEPEIARSVKEGMRRFYDKLRIVFGYQGSLNKAQALKELEIIARSGLVSNIYVWSVMMYVPIIRDIPISDDFEYLEKLTKDLNAKLTTSQKEEIKEARLRVIAELDNERIKKYV